MGPGITSTRAISGTGLKKCMPSTRSGVAAADAMRRHRQAAGVGGQERPGRGGGIEQPKCLALELQVLGDRLDHQVGGGQVFQPGLRPDAPQRRVAVGGRDLFLLDAPRQEAGHPAARLVDRARQRVVQQHLDPRGGRDLDDARAHGAGAQHAEARDPAAALSGQ